MPSDIGFLKVVEFTGKFKIGVIVDIRVGADEPRHRPHAGGRRVIGFVGFR